MEYTPRMTENRLTAQAAAAAGMVLLKNVNETLPLRPAGTEPLPIAVFGTGQVETALCCREFETYRRVSVLDGLCASELVRPDGLLAHRYRSWKLQEPAEEFPWKTLSMEELAEENAAAVVVLTRTEDSYDPIVHQNEQELLKAVSDAFSRVVLVLNTPGYMEIGSVVPLCGAVVYMGIPGQEGGAALAELLTGEGDFRGHLTQSWPLRRADFTQANRVSDIYCGYRYFDTFDTELLYEFGYGLTYGAAALTAVSMAVDNKELIVTAEVANSGETYPVSQVVQVYGLRPGTQLPQPKQVLQGFCRTGLLYPGETETVTVRFPLTALAGFSEEASAFLLEAGIYEFRVGFSSRSTVVAGAVSVPRTQAVRPVLPLQMKKTAVRPAKLPWTYPGEQQERKAAADHALRLSGWNVEKHPLKKTRKPQLCRPAEQEVRLEDVKAGRATVYELIAALSDQELGSLVQDFGFCPTQVPGALGSSADLRESRGIRPLTVAAGADGLLLTRDLRDEEDKVVAHQYVTAFPAASLLSCSWDLELITAVGAAVGREMQEYGVDFWLAPGADIIRRPGQHHVSRCWSEDPLLCGLCAKALARGVAPYGTAVLRSVSMEQQAESSLRVYHELTSLPFAMAAAEAGAVLLPSQRFNGSPCGEDTAQTEMLRQWGFGGVFLADNERYAEEPDRLRLEQSALPILKMLVKG